MELHRGRLIDHVHFRVRDLDASKRFYKAVLQSIGRDLTTESPHHFGSDELWFTAADAKVSSIHLAFQVDNREQVHRFHAAAIAAGGTDNGGPGERSYHPGYYAAFVLDPDGNNIEAVHHGMGERSAASVVIRTPG